MLNQYFAYEKECYNSNMSKKRTVILAAGYAAAFLILAQFDLPFSLEFAQNQNSALAFFGRCISILPGIWIGSLCSAALAMHCLGYKKICLYIVSGVLSAVTVFEYCHYADISFISIVPILCSIILFLATVYLASKSDQSNDEAVKAEWLGLLLLIITNVLLNILKMFWGRTRFYAMSDPAGEFVPWYILRPFAADDYHMSFPSGHTGNASVVMWIVYLPLLYPDFKVHPFVLKGTAALWIIVTALGRIAGGAHFISDTMASIALVYIIYRFLQNKLKMNAAIQ